MVPAEALLLLYGGALGNSGQRRVCGGCRGDLGGGISERLSFMRLLQKVHDFSAIDDEDAAAAAAARLGSDHNSKDNYKVNTNCQDYRQDNNNHHNHNSMADREEPRTSRSSSKDNNNGNTNTNADTDLNQDELGEEGWLRLGIGGQTEAKPNEKTNIDHHHQYHADRVVDPTARTTTDSMLELSLFLGGSAATGKFSNQDQQELRPPLNTSLGASLFYNHHHHHHHHHHHQESSSNGGTKIDPGHHHHHHDQEMIGPWAFRPPFVPQKLSSSSSNLMMPLLGPYLARSHFYRSQLIETSSNYTDVMAMVAGPSSGGLRVVDPPRRTHSGVWFVLQASQNQAREPFLPQIPKSYLRIKDGRMTVRTLMKYLVHKLQLENESEIEIRCRGEELQPALTLQHVRDTIWKRRDSTTATATASAATTSHNFITLLPNSPTSGHLMVLHYARSLL